jgi:hypothetical protein
MHEHFVRKRPTKEIPALSLTSNQTAILYSQEVCHNAVDKPAKVWKVDYLPLEILKHLPESASN